MLDGLHVDELGPAYMFNIYLFKPTIETLEKGVKYVQN